MPLPALAIPALLDIGKNLIDRLLPNPEAKAAAQLELLKLQESGELARLANETKLAELMVEDLKSARERESAIATSENAPYLNKIISPVLSLIVIVGGGFLLVFIPDAEVKYAVVTLMTAVLSYHFGTSAGSTKANQLFRDIVKKNGAP